MCPEKDKKRIAKQAADRPPFELPTRNRGALELVQNVVMAVWVGFQLGVVGSVSSAIGLNLIRASNVLDSPTTALFKRWRFLLGILFANVLTSVLDTIALSLAPLSVLAPLGALTVVLSLAVAHVGACGLTEPLNRSHLAPVSLIVFGIVIITMVGAKPEVDLTMEHITATPGTVLFFVASGSAIFSWLVRLLGGNLARRFFGIEGRSTPTTMALCSALTAGLAAANAKTMMKFLSTDVRARASGLEGAMSMHGVVLASIGLPIFAVLQIYLLNVALRTGRIVLSVPTYMSSTITASMLAGACVFDDMREIHDDWRLWTIATSMAGLIIGIFTLALQTEPVPPLKEAATAEDDTSKMTSEESTSTTKKDVEIGDAKDAPPLSISMSLEGSAPSHPPLSPPDNDGDTMLLAGNDNKGCGPDAGYGWLPGWHTLWTQGMGEFIVMRYHLLEWVLLIGCLFLALLLRRLAYLRHMPMTVYMQRAVGANASDATIKHNVDSFRLRDVGYELIADQSESEGYAIAGDFIAALTGILCMYPLSIGALLRRRPTTRPVFVSSIVMRWFRFQAFIELLRPVFYIWTALPAPDIHCVTHNETVWKPANVAGVLQIGGVMSQGCGDLVFSGHVCSVLTMLLLLTHYGEPLYGRHVRPVLLVYYLLVGTLILINCYVIIAVRHHYTIDLISAAIVTWLSWHKVSGSWMGPRDIHPIQIVNSKRCCSLLGCASSCTSASVHVGDVAASPGKRSIPRHQWAELERMVAVHPWKGHVGVLWIFTTTVLGGIFFFKVVVNSLETVGVIH